MAGSLRSVLVFRVPHARFVSVGLFGPVSFAKVAMPKRLKRTYGFGHLHFITFSCYCRLPLLRSVPARNAFVRALCETRSEYDFKLVGYVVMPEHVHLLISEPSRANPSIVLKMLKQRVSRELRAIGPRPLPAVEPTLPFVPHQPPLRQFWQRRFYDFNVWSRRKKIEKLNYMHMNPVKRGLVENPFDWPWSSFAFYQGRGNILIGMDPVE